jgi:hypothetical protein
VCEVAALLSGCGGRLASGPSDASRTGTDGAVPSLDGGVSRDDGVSHDGGVSRDGGVSPADGAATRTDGSIDRTAARSDGSSVARPDANDEVCASVSFQLLAPAGSTWVVHYDDEGCANDGSNWLTVRDSSGVIVPIAHSCAYPNTDCRTCTSSMLLRVHLLQRRAVS